ncbi:MAG: ATP-binding cassette domain-containing protein [Propionibacteriales bacterium]|nr:ATP-binding cassette domain-containing protein [Propionibacteriales bacterium]
MGPDDTTLLDVRDLHAVYPSAKGTVRAVDDISFTMAAGEVLAIVGESGSGKSATALAIMGLMHRTSGRVVSGEVLFDSRDMLRLTEGELRAIRGSEISMIFQNPMTALNPVLSIGHQLTEVVRAHLRIGRTEAWERAVELLRMVEIPDPRSRLAAYPHQLSGGLRQRVMIAMALSCEPKLLIADEATTALDVTTQSQILKLLRRVTAETRTAVIVITHNMGVVASIADRVAVMYAGRIVELADVRSIFHDPRHPYTVGLLGSIPRIDGPRLDDLVAIEGRPPSLSEPSRGCPFRPRCPLAMDMCADREPLLEPVQGASAHLASCWASATDQQAHATRSRGGLAGPDGRQGES